MQLPESHRQDGMCAKLKHCLYGLKQFQGEWYSRLTQFLLPLGFTISTFDPCKMVYKSQKYYIAIYVDDLTLFGPSAKFMYDTIASLKKGFEVTDLSNVHWLLESKLSSPHQASLSLNKLTSTKSYHHLA